MTTSIQIEPVCPQFHQAVAELMAYGFGHKFQKITSLSITDLAYVFEQLLNHPPIEKVLFESLHVKMRRLLAPCA